MNFFQLQNKLFYSKKDNAGYLDTEGESAFVPFLLNRWLSFYDKSAITFVNDSLNRYAGLFDDKQQQYRLYYNLIPRLKFKRINYIKKNKIKKEDELNEHIFARNNNISVREVKQYVDLCNTLHK